MVTLKDKRILAVMGYEGYFGGERANLQVLKMLRSAGADIECIVLKCGGKDFREALHREGFKLHSARFGPSLFGLSGNPVHYLKNLVGMAFVSLKVLMLSRKLNPTHVYVPNYIQFLYVWPSLFFIKTPVVFRIGDPPENTRLHRYLWKSIVSPKVKFFVANSKYTLSRLFSNGVPESKGRVINNCLTRSYGNDEPIVINQHERVIIYVGQINEQKGVDIAVHAAVDLCKKYDDINFKFIGPFDENSQYVKTMFDLLKNEGLKDRVVFCGFKNDILRYFRSSCLHICPSTQEESSANVVIEAKTCGVPSVVFPKGGLPELINHEIDGYVCESSDVRGLVQGIDYFLSDQAKMNNASLQAKRSSTEFGEEVARVKWVGLFCEN